MADEQIYLSRDDAMRLMAAGQLHYSTDDETGQHTAYTTADETRYAWFRIDGSDHPEYVDEQTARVIRA